MPNLRRARIYAPVTLLGYECCARKMSEVQRNKGLPATIPLNGKQSATARREPVMPIYRFLKEDNFDQDTVDRMTAAYEAALKLAGLDDRAHVVAEMVARKIIRLVHEGENDPPRMCARALKELGIPIAE
jgi:hypothetical protein